MATDPVSAFLTGFRAVDQYETNKLNREFARERQSRLRTIWERQDELWARDELKHVQAKRREQLEAYSADLWKSLQLKSGEVYKAALEAGDDEQTARDKQGQWLNDWFGPNPAEKFNSQVLRIWGQADPEALEHFALANGRDPAAGPLVDRRNPVANIGIVPEDLAKGNIELWMEYNRKDGGTGPATKNRTDRPDDSVDFVTPTTAAMVKFFGPEYRTMETPTIMFWREMIDAQEAGSPRGNMTEEQVKQHNAAPPKPSGGAATTASSTTNNQTRREQLNEEALATGGATTTDGGTFTSNELATANLTPEQASSMTKAEVIEAFEQNSRTVGAVTAASEPEESDLEVVGEGLGYPVVRKRSDRGITADAQDRLTDVLRAETEYGPDNLDAVNAADQIRLGIGGAIDVGATGVSGAATAAGNFLERKTRPIREFTGALFSGVPENSTEVAKAPGNEDITRQAVIEDPSNTGKNAPPVSTEDGSAQAAAKMVGNASQSKRRIPFRHEMYAAAQLRNSKYISDEDFQAFGRTGSLPKNVQAQMFQIGNTIVGVTQDRDTGEISMTGALQVGSGQGGLDTQEEIRLQGLWDDKLRMIEDEGERQLGINYGMEAVNLFRKATDLRADQSVINMIAESIQLVNQVDNNTIQGLWDKFAINAFGEGGGELIDLSKDYKRQLNAMTISIGAILARNYVTDQRDFTQAMIQYARDYRPGVAEMPDDVFLKKASAMEGEISRATAAARNSEDGEAVIKIRDGNKVVGEIKVNRKDQKFDVRDKYITKLLSLWYNR